MLVARKLPLSRKNFCRDKIKFLSTNTLLRQEFCRDKSCVLSRQTRVTKLILVAAPATDNPEGWGWGGGDLEQRCRERTKAEAVVLVA